MATYEALRQAIDTLIKANGNKEITGDILNNVLNTMLTALSANYQFCGEAKPNTAPGQPLQNLFYFAYEAGTYLNFGGITLPLGISMLKWDGTAWTGENIYTFDAQPLPNSSNMISSGAVFNALMALSDAMHSGKVFVGIAEPSTTPDGLTNGQPIFYLATEKGTYSHFFVNGDIPMVLEKDGIWILASGADDDDWNAVCLIEIDSEPQPFSNELISSKAVYHAIRQFGESFGFGRLYNGIATPTKTPEPLQGRRMFYLATQAGTYEHFFANGDIPLVLPHDGLYAIFSVTGEDDDDWNWEQILQFDDEVISNSHNLPTSMAVYNTLEAFKAEVNALIQDINPTVIEGNVTNAPDEEDLTSVDERLKFKNKEYNSLSASGLGRVYLRKNWVNGVNTLTQSMMNKANTIYHIQYDYVLGEDITVPANSVLEFDGGSVSGNHTITGQNTTISGTPKIDFLFNGTFANSEIFCSWIISDSATTLSSILTSIINIGMTVYVDKDISLDGTKKTVNDLKIVGDGHTITNPNKYQINGNIQIENVRFIGVTISQTDVFLFPNDYSQRNIEVVLKNIYFDGANNCNRFYNHYSESDSTTVMNLVVEDCVIENVNEFGFRHTGNIIKGKIKNNVFKNIGITTQQLGSSIAIALGKAYLAIKTAENVVIESNIIDTVKCMYTTLDDGKETHGILIYGNRCSILNNKVLNFISEREDKDPGAETEGIYVKGSYNVISGNMLIDACGGTYSDGSITLKGLEQDEESAPARNNNIISDNVIIHKFGIAITYYGINGIVSNNTISSSGDARGEIDLLVAEDSIISNNKISFDNNKQLKVHSGFFIVIRSKNITISNNVCEGQTALLVDYSVGKLFLKSNVYTLENSKQGSEGNLKYNSIIQSASDAVNTIYIEDCIFNIGSSRGTALVEVTSVNKLYFNNCRFNLYIIDSSEITTLFIGLFRDGHFECVNCIFDIDAAYDARNVFYADNSDKFANCVFTNKVLNLNTTKVIGDYQFPT